jgi:hypothetical protein
MLASAGCVTTPTMPTTSASSTSTASGGGRSVLGVLPENSRENEIFMQAVGGGALLGGAAGAVIADRMGSNMLLGGALGSMVGAAAGKAVADQQIRNLRDVTLEADQLEAVLAEARAYNDDVAEYNAGLEREIARLRSLDESERARLAQTQLRDAELSRQRALAQSEKRQQVIASLAPEQQSKVRAEDRALEAQIKVMDTHIAELRGLSSGRVGIG